VNPAEGDLTGEDMPFEMFVSSEGLAAVRAEHHFGSDDMGTERMKSRLYLRCNFEKVCVNERMIVCQDEEQEQRSEEAGCRKADERMITWTIITRQGDKARGP
jgi:hypothetical protein